MEIDESIFKAYDIRGKVPEQLNEELALRIGKAVVKFLKCKRVVVGKDMREHSRKLTDSLIEGITSMGADVIDLGMCTTPMNYYANGVFETDASVMVTASHNTSEYNGFKICKAKAVPLSGDTGIQDIKELVKENNFNQAEQKGKVEQKDIGKPYNEFIAKHYHNTDKKLKIVADCANSMGVFEMKSLKLPGVEIIPLFEELDSSFPNHEANPIKEETLKQLQEKVIKENADLGIGFDGDADRVGVVDENGEIIRSDFITTLIAKDILEEKPKSKIFFDLRSSKVVKEVIEKNNGTALMCRVGHAFIKAQMRDEGAVFAGELSGHFYFAENFNAESAALAVVRIMNMLEKTGRNLSELVNELKVYAQSGEINRKVTDPDKIIKKVEEHYSDAKIYHLDGVSVEYDNWWFNIRKSNTEPVLRINLEADTKELMEEKLKEVLELYE
ncbi:MAG: phosphomannomutase/phosphoglucomutase [Candidatus Nanoarchaeia archaeon]